MRFATDEEVVWTEVSRDLEQGGMTYAAVCHKYRISRRQLQNRIRACKWQVPERDDDGDLGIRLDALLVALEKQIERISEIVDMASDGSREVAVLNTLATTLERLTRLEGRTSAKRPTARQSKELEDLRGKIAKRLDALGVN